MMTIKYVVCTANNRVINCDWVIHWSISTFDTWKFCKNHERTLSTRTYDCIIARDLEPRSRKLWRLVWHHCVNSTRGFDDIRATARQNTCLATCKRASAEVGRSRKRSEKGVITIVYRCTTPSFLRLCGQR